MTEAEYMPLAWSIQQALWMNNFLLEIELVQQLPFEIYINNMPTISLADSTKGHAQAKHIDTRYHYIHEHIHDSNIKLNYIPSSDNITDLFTKPLAKPAYDRFVRLLGLKGACSSGGVLEV